MSCLNQKRANHIDRFGFGEELVNHRLAEVLGLTVAIFGSSGEEVAVPILKERDIDDIAKIRPVGMTAHIETEFGIRPTEIFGFKTEFSDRPFLKLSHVLEHRTLRLKKGGVYLDCIS